MQRLALAKEASSHTPFQFFTSGDLSFLGPSVLLVHQPPAGFISFLTELGPCGHGFNWPLVSIFNFPDPLPSAVCPPANLQLRIPPSNPSLCLAPLEPSPAGVETHTTPQVDIVKEWGLLTSAEFFILLLTLSSVELSQVLVLRFQKPPPAEGRSEYFSHFLPAYP